MQRGGGIGDIGIDLGLSLARARARDGTADRALLNSHPRTAEW